MTNFRDTSGENSAAPPVVKAFEFRISPARPDFHAVASASSLRIISTLNRVAVAIE